MAQNPEGTDRAQRETARLLDIMRRLRDPDTGCPWDLRQDFASIAPYTIEEAYEVAEAIHRGDLEALRGELGDLLLQVVYHAQMAEEEGAFDYADAAKAVADKMVRRHPHVFGDAENDGSFGAAQWEEQKRREGGGNKSVLDGAARGPRAMDSAVALGLRAARVGFDWPDAESVWAKVEEEIGELRAAKTLEERREELGDVLFSLASLARHMRINPEAALEEACEKFRRRFGEVERQLEERGMTPADASLEEMERLWREAAADEAALPAADEKLAASQP